MTKIQKRIDFLKEDWGVENGLDTPSFQDFLCNYNDHPCDCDTCLELTEMTTSFFYSMFKDEWNFMDKLEDFHICKGKNLISLEDGKRYYTYGFLITNEKRPHFKTKLVILRSKDKTEFVFGEFTKYDYVYGCFRYDYNGRNWMRRGELGRPFWKDLRTEKRILRSIWNCREVFNFPKSI